ncbi:MAG: VOC family protein [Pseudomonadota bacterium]
MTQAPASTTPSALIGSLTLTVNDAARVADFYERVIGLTRFTPTSLGIGDTAVLHLHQDKAARRRPNEAGLFHTAFLLPDRAALGLWLNHAAEAGLNLDGAADHLVSEAVYLHDPEGNGVEVYADRPRAVWPRRDEQILLDSKPLDLEALAAEGAGTWRGAPLGTTIGHVHLQVGETEAADAFYTGILPFQRMFAMGNRASFYGADGYHHQLAGNTWNSGGAGTRSADATGLAELELRIDPALCAPDTFTDPWGTTIRVTAA